MTASASADTRRPNTTNTLAARDAALHAERRDLIAAHRQLLDCGVTSQTTEVHDRLAEIDLEAHDIAAQRRALSMEALP